MNCAGWYCNYSSLHFVLHWDRLRDHSCHYGSGFREDIAYWSRPRIQRCIGSTDVLQFCLNYHIRDVADLFVCDITRNKLGWQRESLIQVLYIPSTSKNIRGTNTKGILSSKMQHNRTFIQSLYYSRYNLKAFPSNPVSVWRVSRSKQLECLIKITSLQKSLFFCMLGESLFFSEKCNLKFGFNSVHVGWLP